jgi:hypothetical protein
MGLKQLNEIPAGFNNNIIWNVGHLVASQQGLCYIRAGLTPVVEKSFIQAYSAGTKPEQPVGFNEVDRIKSLCISSLDRLDEDYQKGLFQNYEERRTRYGVTLRNIDDVLPFLLFHEGFHLSAIMALIRCSTRT